MVKDLVTYEDIAAHFGVELGTAQRWGRKGICGEAVIKYPAHFEPSALDLIEAWRKSRFKLSDDDVAEMFEMAKTMTNVAIAEHFGVNDSYVSMLLSGKRRANG